MPPKKVKAAEPLTFDLPVSLIAKIDKVRRGHALGSASEVVRLAIAQFDCASFYPSRDPHRQISVRIGAKQRSDLRQAARRSGASIGEIVRAALEQINEKPPRGRASRRRRA